MAGLPWFKLASDFPGHPKEARLCARLKDPNAGMHVVRLLAHCARYAPDGRIAVDLLSTAAGAAPKRAEIVASALQEAGFIELEGDSFVVHGWEERNAAHVRKAAKDAKKPRGNRTNPDAIPTPSPAGPERDESGTDAGPALEIEKEREKKTAAACASARTEPETNPSPEAATPPPQPETSPTIEAKGEETAASPRAVVPGASPTGSASPAAPPLHGAGNGPGPSLAGQDAQSDSVRPAATRKPSRVAAGPAVDVIPAPPRKSLVIEDYADQPAATEPAAAPQEPDFDSALGLGGEALAVVRRLERRLEWRFKPAAPERRNTVRAVWERSVAKRGAMAVEAACASACERRRRNGMDPFASVGGFVGTQAEPGILDELLAGRDPPAESVPMGRTGFAPRLRVGAPRRFGDLGTELMPWWMRLTREQLEEYVAQRTAIDPELADAPFGLTGTKHVAEVEALNEKWRDLVMPRTEA